MRARRLTTSPGQRRWRSSGSCSAASRRSSRPARWSSARRGGRDLRNAPVTMGITPQMAVRLGSLPADKLQEVLDFIEFVQGRAGADGGNDAQPFRGMPVSYLDPTEPVAAEDWEAAR